MKKYSLLFLLLVLTALTAAGCGKDRLTEESTVPEQMIQEQPEILPTANTEAEKPADEAPAAETEIPETVPVQMPTEETEEVTETTESAYTSGTYTIDGTAEKENGRYYITVVFTDGELVMHDYSNPERGKGCYYDDGGSEPAQNSPYYGWSVEQVLEDLQKQGYDCRLDG